jgi:type II secretory pathway pseudopilin PulG
MTSRFSQSGMTVIEALVVMVLFLGTMTLVTTLFTYASQSTTRSMSRTDSQGALTNASQILRDDVSNSPRSGQLYFYLQNPTGRDDLAAALLTTEDANGVRGWDAAKSLPTYQGYYVIYRDATDNTLRRLYQAITPTNVAAPPLEADVRNAILNTPSRPLAKGVTLFALQSLLTGVAVDFPTNPVGFLIQSTSEKGAPVKTSFTIKSPTI